MKTSSKLAVTGLVSSLQGSLRGLAFLLVLVMPAWALAAATAIEQASSEVLSILIPIFVAVAGALATWILSKIQKKLGIDVGDKTAAAWDELARKAARRGGEWARNKTKQLTEGKKVPGGEVMEVAANWAIEMAKHQKLPVLARNKLEGLIEAHLFELRLDEEAAAAADVSIVGFESKI